MNNPANQHTTPEGILRNFTFNGTQLLFFDKRKHDEPVPKSPTKTFRRRHIYTRLMADGSRDYSAEHFLDREVERKIIPIIRSLLILTHTRFHFDLHIESKNTFYKFIASSAFRSPAVSERIKLLPEEDLFGLMPATLSAYQSPQNKIPKEEIANNLHGEIILTELPSLEEEIKNYGIHLLRTPNSQNEFIAGNNPFVRFTLTEDEKGWYPLGVNADGVEMMIAVAPSLAILLSGDNDSGKFLTIEPEMVRRYNAAVARQSNQLVGRSRHAIMQALEDSLVDSEEYVP